MTAAPRPNQLRGAARAFNATSHAALQASCDGAQAFGSANMFFPVLMTLKAPDRKSCHNSHVSRSDWEMR